MYAGDFAVYGMIHQAARDMVLDRYGVDVWNTILASSGLDNRHFIGAEHFPDDVTYALIGQIVAHSGLSSDDLLEQFGEHWVVFATGTSFAPILEMAGGDFVALIRNLDRMHSSISASMPRAEMPSFDVIAADDSRIEIVYRSKRPGLGAFAKGLLQGLMARFGEAGEITGAPAGAGRENDVGTCMVYPIRRTGRSAEDGASHSLQRPGSE
jgi:hypothetical protein